MKTKKTVLVTGGAGFLGSHLCEKLLKKGYKVICLDNLVSGSLANIERFSNLSNFFYINEDILNPITLNEKVDEIYNLACPASPVDYKYLPLETLLACSYGVKNVLDFALHNNAKVLHTSTSEVYGDPLVHPQKEDYFGNVNPIGERSCYDEGKRFAESFITNYRKKYGINLKIVRLFNTYGPNMRLNDGRIVPNFINQAMRGEGITVYGKGLHTRSFCYVSDTINGIYKMMQSSIDGPINIGNPDERTMLDVAKTILKITKSKSKIVYRPFFTENDPLKRQPDITLAKKYLNWRPKISFDEGIKKTYNYFKSL